MKKLSNCCKAKLEKKTELTWICTKCKKPCDLYSEKTNYIDEIKEICTYHSDGGTSGYSLSEKQFEKINNIIQKVQQKKVEEIRKEIEELGMCNGQIFQRKNKNDYLEALSDLSNLKLLTNKE